MTTQLSVNVNKIAVLRNSRGGSEPDPVDAARAALAAGANGITVHPRPDQRHIRVGDVARIAAVVGGAEYNIEAIRSRRRAARIRGSSSSCGA